MGDNLIKVRSREHRQSPKPFRSLRFSDDVEVLCTFSSRQTCILTHCAHDMVQDTINHLYHRLCLVSAPLSKHEVLAAVSSSKTNEPDSFSLMQKLPKPIQHNAPDEPAWYAQHAVGGFPAGDSSSSESDRASSEHFEDDPEDHDEGGSPPDDPGIHPPDQEDGRQSVLLYHLDDVPAHTMLHWDDFETMMREVAHHFAVDRVDLLACHDMTTLPADVPEGTVPLIVQMTRDIPVGDSSVLVMIDIIVHGQAQEPHFSTAPRARRKVLAVPVMLVRQALLIQTQVFEYCRFEHNRCLVRHEDDEWPLQEVLPRRMQHGNYIQIIVPPPERCEVPTRVMLEESRTLEVEAFWERYYIPTPPSAQEESEESELDVSPSLANSDDIRREFGHLDGDRNDTDLTTLMQRPPHELGPSDVPHATSSQAASSSDAAAPMDGSLAEATQQIVNDSCILQFNPFTMTRVPLWYRALATAFREGADIERDDEGPVAYLTTWYADCTSESTSEDSRTVRLDYQSSMWALDIQHVWRDRIQAEAKVHFAWVFPTPNNAPAVHTIGHLIVYQHPNEQLAPVLMSFNFRALHLDGTSHAVAVIRHGIAPRDLARLVKLDRVCGGRRCTLHRGTPGKKWYDQFTHGEGIKMCIPSPGEMADPELHWGLDAVVLVHDISETPLVPLHPVLSMRLEDQPLFIQRLHELWVRFGQKNEISNERFLEVTTWYLDGIVVSYNDQQRPVLLGGDFTEWIGELRRVWHDLEDATEDMEFAFVRPTPACSPLSAVHILLYQQIDASHVGLIVTKYDNAVMQGRPFSAAAVCANPISRSSLLFVIGKAEDCQLPGVQCQVWRERHAIEAAGPAVDHGTNLQVHIYRQVLHAWDQQDEETDANVFMQNSHAQASASQQLPVASGDHETDSPRDHCAPFVLNAFAAEFLPERPLIAALPEHMQDLYSLWDRHAVTEEAGSRKSSVQTWYLSPGTDRLRCGYCRKVHLSDNYMQWEQAMKNAWIDQIMQNCPVFFFVVQPTPIALEHDIAAHVLIVQEPTETQVTSLVTVFDAAIHHGHPFRLAVVTHEHITQEEIIERIGYTHELHRLGEQIQCTFQHASFTIPIGSAVPGRDGDHVVVTIQRRMIEADWTPPFLPVAPGMEGLQFLQQDATVRRKSTTHETPTGGVADDGVRIDMRPAIEAFEWLDTHFTLLTFIPPESIQIPSESQPWLNLPLWDLHLGGQEIWIYFDGSYQANTEQAGMAVAVFVKCSGQWYNAGFLSSIVVPTGSYTAEMFAAIAAAKTAHDILKVFATLHPDMPSVWFCYDALTVGKQLIGEWKCARNPLHGRCMRMLIDLVEARFSTVCKGAHIRSHQGEPGNELVDALANGAAHGHATHDLEPFFRQILCKSFVNAGEWMWFLFDRKYADLWTHTQVRFPSGSSTVPDVDVLKGLNSSHELPRHDVGALRLTLATGNVLTLKGTTEMKFGSIAGPTRQEGILRQLHEAGVHIFALQETRLRKAHVTQHPNFLLFSSQATAAGQFGILMGFSTVHAHGTVHESDARGGADVFFQKNHFAVIAQDPRYLIVRVRSPVIQCIAIAAHAPHSGASEQEIESWWCKLDGLIPSRYQTWARILLVDANARIGSYPSDNVGSWQAEADTAKSEPFLQFLHCNSLWLPATFETCQVGEGGTWRHNKGHWLRNDFVALPFAWNCRDVKAFVSSEVDLSTVKEDHALAIVEMTADVTPLASPRTCKIDKRTDQDSECISTLGETNRFWIPWHVDVHTHAHEIQCHLLRQIPKRVKRGRPLKATMTDDTWALVREKKFWRNQMWENARNQRLTWLNLCFEAWKHPETNFPAAEVHNLQKQQDTLCASAYGMFRQLGRQVVSAMRRDDAAFFAQMARQAGDLTHPHQAREFWRVIRRSLPKMKVRRQQISPMQLEHLEEQWHPYFQDLEVGISTTPEQLLRECCSFQSMHKPVETVCTLAELPSRAQLVNAFRDTSPYKATGLDPIPSGLVHRFPVQMAALCWDLFMKVFAWQQEPIQAKGGILAVIPKKNDQTRASHFRGIMLLPTIYKRLHALLREQVIEIIAPLKPAGQIGGFQGQQVQFGSMSLQCFSRIAKHYNLSMGVVFVDLANAFHRLIRELVCGIARQEDAEELIHSLAAHGCPTAGVKKWLEFPNLLQRLGAPRRLINLLRDVHTHTWHVLSAHPGLTRTRRGTRPGSPLADVVFHVAMLDITIELNEWVSQDQSYQMILRSLGLEMEAIVWSDDLAIPWLTSRADELPSAIEKLLQQIHKVFQRRGFELNMQKGKTTAVVAFRGLGAPDMRRKYQLASAAGISCHLAHDQDEWLHFVPAYKHLGTYFAADGGFQVEMSHRIGQALAAFSQLAKPVLCNRHIAKTTRLRLFHALIGTKLFFGLGAWPTPTPRQIDRLNAVLAKCLRRILGLVHYHDSTHVTNAQVFASAKCLDVRARLAQDRLLLAHKVFQHGPAFLHHNLHREFEVGTNSWLHGVFADLRWLSKIDAQAIPVEWTHDLTAAIDYWQKGGHGWKSTLQRLGRKHVLQESMMTEVQGWHRKIFHVLEKAEGSLRPKPNDVLHESGPADFQCFCGRAFTTAVGMATHQRKAHQMYSIEHDLLAGATCPACLRHFWSTQRLQQHLAYVSRRTGRNECYQNLMRAGYTATYSRENMPKELQGMDRANWIQACGPQPLPKDQRISLMVRYEEEVMRLEQQILEVGIPGQSQQRKELFFLQLNQCTFQWLTDFQEAGFDADAIATLSERWTDAIAIQLETLQENGDEIYHDQWLERCFLQWGQQELCDVIAQFEDGEAERIADEEFAEFAQEFSTTNVQARIQFLKQRIQGLLDQDPIFPHRAIKPHPCKRYMAHSDDVVMKFEEQMEWHNRLRQVGWDQCMPRKPIPRLLHGNVPHFLIVHLFSGRRRDQDVHHWLAQWANLRGIQVTVLSMDTAVSQAYGNLQVETTSWKKLVQLYEQGAVAATLAGSPCETFSAARHLPPPEHIDASRWPRPLRSADRLFGLAQLTRKELRQCKQGTAFALQTLFVAALHLVHGGLFLSEHPACPDDETKASIWRSALVGLLIQDPDFVLKTFPQWKWGSATPKPTGLLSLRLPMLVKSMYACADPDLPYPRKVAQGVDDQGSFNTAACKEYPPLFCKALARALTDQFEVALRAHEVVACTVDDPEIHQWLHEAAVESAIIHSFTTFRPDFQGR